MTVRVVGHVLNTAVGIDGTGWIVVDDGPHRMCLSPEAARMLASHLRVAARTSDEERQRSIGAGQR